MRSFEGSEPPNFLNYQTCIFQKTLSRTTRPSSTSYRTPKTTRSREMDRLHVCSAKISSCCTMLSGVSGFIREPHCIENSFGINLRHQVDWTNKRLVCDTLRPWPLYANPSWHWCKQKGQKQIMFILAFFRHISKDQVLPRILKSSSQTENWTPTSLKTGHCQQI